MFIPDIHQQNNPEKLKQFIQDYPLATLINHGDSGIMVDHLPLILREDNLFIGHVFRANPVWKNIQDGSDCLAIFHGPDAYISANYYPSKAQHGKVVPTWNYMVTHVQGKIRFIDNRDWVLQAINDLTAQQEQSQAQPWSTADMPADFLESNLKAVIGFEIAIESMQGNWKLSGNKNAEDYAGVIAGLQASCNSKDKALATEMEKIKLAQSRKSKTGDAN